MGLPCAPITNSDLLKYPSMVSHLIPAPPNVPLSQNPVNRKMDLDLEFDGLNDTGAPVPPSGSAQIVDGDSVEMTAVEALKYMDDNWYKKIAGKKARWMDLIGDYAGNERFILDGNVHFSRHRQWVANMPFCT